MTPAEKAKELVNKFFRHDFLHHDINYQQAKQCALIAVQERIDEGYEWMGGGNTEWEKDRYNYWQEVKQEIKNL